MQPHDELITHALNGYSRFYKTALRESPTLARQVELARSLEYPEAAGTLQDGSSLQDFDRKLAEEAHITPNERRACRFLALLDALTYALPAAIASLDQRLQALEKAGGR